MCSKMKTRTFGFAVLTSASLLLTATVAGAKTVRRGGVGAAIRSQAANPPYLSQMPSMEGVATEIKGADAMDTAARRMGAFWQLMQIIQELAGQRLYRNQLTPDEGRLIGQYRLGYSTAEQPYAHIPRSPSHPDKEKWFKAHTFYENDPGFRDELLNKFFTEEFRAAYYRVTGRPRQGNRPAGNAPPAAAAKPSDQQTRPTPSRCPVVRVTCLDTVEENRPATFAAEVSGGDPKVTPTFNWTVSAGMIQSGRGTSAIVVDMTGFGGMSMTTTINVGGFARDCDAFASCNTSVLKKAELIKFDKYGGPPAERNARLDDFALGLKENPDALVHIISYGGRTSRPGEAKAAADKVKDYLVTTRGIDASRVVTVDGGYREDRTVELWLAPAGASPPAPTPTVDPKDVKPARRRAAKPRTPPKAKKT